MAAPRKSDSNPFKKARERLCWTKLTSRNRSDASTPGGRPMKSWSLKAVAIFAAAAAFAPAAQAQQPLKLFPEGDIVRGNSPLGATGPICVLNSQFKRGENVVFRIRV